MRCRKRPVIDVSLGPVSESAARLALVRRPLGLVEQVPRSERRTRRRLASARFRNVDAPVASPSSGTGNYFSHFTLSDTVEVYSLTPDKLIIKLVKPGSAILPLDVKPQRHVASQAST